MVWETLIAAGGQLGGAAISAYGQHQANEANQRMFQKQMEHQLYMSNTAHQREVDDLRAAGLNPILSGMGGSGASSGSVSAPTMQNELGSVGDAVGSAVGTAFNFAQKKNELQMQDRSIVGADISNENAKLEGELKKAQIAYTLANTQNKNANTGVVAGKVPEAETKAKLWKAIDTVATPISNFIDIVKKGVPAQSNSAQKFEQETKNLKGKIRDPYRKILESKL